MIEETFAKSLIKNCVASNQALFFETLKQNRYSGKIIFKQNSQTQWYFYFYLGRIIYATGGLHPVRRYKRNLAVYMPSMIPELALLEREPLLVDSSSLQECWEYELLRSWIGANKIDRKKVNNFIFAQVGEILFDLIQAKSLKVEYDTTNCLSEPIILIDSEQVVSSAAKIWENWQNSKLADRLPDTAPVVIHPEELRLHTNSKTYEGMVKLLDGRRSLRDLAVVLKQDLIQFTMMLTPYIQMGLIELSEISDLKQLIKPSVTKKLLIACVDDSPMICQSMAHLVTGAGYDFIGINDDLRAISLLLNHKPDMIFLDLIMPHINGYEICSKLRKVSAFSETPIIILSSYINVLDRFKAKRSRCSDFLSKPINPSLVFSSISRYLACK